MPVLNFPNQAPPSKGAHIPRIIPNEKFFYAEFYTIEPYPDQLEPYSKRNLRKSDPISRLRAEIHRLKGLNCVSKSRIKGAVFHR